MSLPDDAPVPAALLPEGPSPILTRLVRMHFLPDRVDEFLEIWRQYRAHIAAAPGCLTVGLLQDHTDPTVLYTLSQWEGPAALEGYRRSALFGEVWPQTRALFATPAQTFSMMPPPPDQGGIDGPSAKALIEGPQLA